MTTEDTGSSEEEFQSLLDRVRLNQNLGGRTAASPRPPPGTAHMVSVLFKGLDVAKLFTLNIQESQAHF